MSDFVFDSIFFTVRLHPVKEKPHYIYLLTNTVNGKIYVGRSKFEPAKRFRQHVKQAFKNCNTSLGRAILKHGAEAFKVETLDTTLAANIHAAEEAWITKLGSADRGKGYNLTSSSCGSNGVVGLPTREKLSKVSKAYWESVDKEVRSAMLSERMTGLPKSESHRRSCSVAKVGKGYGGSSSYVGVRRKSASVWDANCYHEGRSYGKTCATEEEAAITYDRLSIALRGPASFINFEGRRAEYQGADVSDILKSSRPKNRYKHVYYNTSKKKWQAGSRTDFVGLFNSEVKAARAMAKRLNLPSSKHLLRPSRRKISRPPLSAS